MISFVSLPWYLFSLSLASLTCYPCPGIFTLVSLVWLAYYLYSIPIDSVVALGVAVLELVSPLPFTGLIPAIFPFFTNTVQHIQFAG